MRLIMRQPIDQSGRLSHFAFTGLVVECGDVLNLLVSTAPPMTQHILMVDDDSLLRRSLALQLQQAGYRTSSAATAEDGLAISQRDRPDLVLLDVGLPGMDGLEAVQQFKRQGDLPVIFLTARRRELDTILGLELGADDYITKPFNPELLEVRIENLLSQRHKLRQIFNRDFLLTPQEVQLTSPDEELLNRLVKIMKDNLEEPEFNVNKMCEMVHLSHMHFIRKVKQLTGKKPIDLLRSFRMKRAKDLLCQNKLTISEVAYKVGYDLPNSFSRAFKKEFGISPTEFVEQPEILES